MDSLTDSLHQLKLKDAKSIIYIYRPVYEKNSTTLSYMLRETVEIDINFYPPKHTVINIHWTSTGLPSRTSYQPALC